jgi:BASS family bile acid:Na+ symporter
VDVKELVPLFIQISLTLIVAAAGMRSEWRDLRAALGHPGRLLRGILAVNVAVPLAAVLAVHALPIDQPVKQGIVIMAVSPLAPLVPGRLLKAGADASVAVGFYVALIVLAVIIVPLTVALLAAITSTQVFLAPGQIAWLTLTSMLAPLLGGLLIANLLPRQAPVLAKIAGALGNVMLLLFVVILLYKFGGEMLRLAGDGALVACVVAVSAGLAAGHLLGGPEPVNRIALAIAAATRHPGIAVMIAHSALEDRRVVLAVLLFLFVSVILSGLYQAWAMKRLVRAGAATPEPAPPQGRI